MSNIEVIKFDLSEDDRAMRFSFEFRQHHNDEEVHDLKCIGCDEDYDNISIIEGTFVFGCRPCGVSIHTRLKARKTFTDYWCYVNLYHTWNKKELRKWVRVVNRWADDKTKARVRLGGFYE